MKKAPIREAAKKKVVAKKKSSDIKAKTKVKAKAKTAKRSGVDRSNGIARKTVRFKAGEFVVCPPHGVGKIIEVDKQTIDGVLQEQAVIELERDKCTMRVPLLKVENVGLRHLSGRSVVTKAMETLRRRAQIKRTMWSRRSQEYTTKIESGDLVAIAEVTRDLFRPNRQTEQSYSERQLYEAAVARMAQELAVIDSVDEESALKKIEANLQRAYSPVEGVMA